MPSALAVLRLINSSSLLPAAPAGRLASRPLECGPCRRQPDGRFTAVSVIAVIEFAAADFLRR